MSKPLILITNDDGITAKGISVLVKLMSQIGEVIVMAPNSPQSGMGHAITVGQPLRTKENRLFGEDIAAYECSGTPADCVKIAQFQLPKNRKFDLVVSGINHGSNTSVSVLYSGTMSAAIEASIDGTPAIGFSLCDYSNDADFSHSEEFILKIAKETLEKGIPRGIALNVNIPKKQGLPIKGIKVCRQTNARWGPTFDQRKDPHGQDYFWMMGEFINTDRGEDHDEWAIGNNYISIVPCQFDMTGHHAITQMNEEWDL